MRTMRVGPHGRAWTSEKAAADAGSCATGRANSQWELTVGSISRKPQKSCGVPLSWRMGFRRGRGNFLVEYAARAARAWATCGEAEGKDPSW
jgi:hypothetical protein